MNKIDKKPEQRNASVFLDNVKEDQNGVCKRPCARVYMATVG